MQGFNVQIGADVSNFDAGINQVKRKLGSLPSVTNQATLSLSNLSRVAQDAPYGFIGIANNINPLLESFQRLKQTTGTTSGAFKAMASQLTGPAGIGLAVGVVSSLIVVFSDKLFGSGKAAKAAADENEKLAASISGDIVKLTSLVAIVTNVNAAQKDRVDALKAVNQEYGKYLTSLGIEEATLKNINTAYEKIIDSLLRQAVVKGLQEEIEKAVKKTAAAIIALQKGYKDTSPDLDNLNKGQVENTGTLAKQTKGTEDLTKAIQKNNKATVDGYLAQQRNLQVTNAQFNATNNYDTALQKLKDQLKKDLEPLFDGLKGFSFADLNIKLDKLNLKPDKVEIDKERVLEIPDMINVKVKDLTFDTSKIKIGGPIGAFEEASKRIDAQLKPIREQLMKLKELGEFVGNGIANAFSDAFTAIGKGENPIRALGEALKQLVLDLIQAALRAFIVKAIVNAFAPGLGSIANGGALSGLMGGIPGFANGGHIAGRQLSVVGERGPELFVPSTSGRIIPNHQLNGIAGAGFQTIRVTGTLRGSGRDMVAVISQENRYQSRNV